MVDTWRPHQGDQSHPHTPNGQIPLQNTPHLPECPAITDHMPATTSLEIKLKKPKQENPLPRLFNVQCLSEDADVQTQYNLAVMNRFRCLVDLPEDVNSQWSTFCSILTDFAKEAVGYRSHIRQMWFSENTFQILKQKSKAKLGNDHTGRKRLHGIFKVKAKADQTKFLSHMADEVEEDLLHNCKWSLYKTITGGHHTSPSFTTIKKSNGTSCNSTAEVLDRGYRTMEGTLLQCYELSSMNNT